MILSRRAQRSPSHISHPINSELAPCFSTPELLASPPTTPPRSHKHSLSKPMAWLNRSSSSTPGHSTPHVVPKPTRISEPKAGSSLDQFTFRRSGPLGSGATIVRTPQEALFGSSCTFEQINEKQGTVEQDILLHDHTEEDENRSLPSPTHSPPLPPLPDISDAAGEGGDDRSNVSASLESLPASDHALHPRLPGSPCLKTHCSSSQPTMQVHTHLPSRSTPPIPTEANIVSSQLPFDAILLSPIPDGSVDPSRLIVALETCTTTYRTSLRTLISRPSHLSRYLTSLSPVSETASVYSNSSDVSLAQISNRLSSVLHDHLATSSSLPRPPNAIHIFLDRPSAPYMHVLAHLRSLPSTPERPETLPRAVQYASQSPSRLESLLELCDEASYLGLDALYDLCCREISRVPRTPLPACFGSGILRSKTGSVQSFRMVVEQSQAHQDVWPPETRTSKCSTGTAAKTVTRESSPSSLCEKKDLLAVREQRKGDFKYEVGSPPPGWI